jgi:4-amino-4-deoxy-L-arabinose transferase-like glycosyltransferase
MKIDSSFHGSKHKPITWFVLFVALLLGLAVRFPHIGRGLGEDELFTAVNFVEGSLWNTVTDIGGFNNHIGYSLLARAAERVFGRSEQVLRLPSLLLGLATIVLIFLLCRELFSEGFGLLAGFLLAVSPAHVDWSVQARGYSGMVFFTLLSAYLFFRLLKRPNRVEALVFTASNIAAVYIHLYSIFAIAGELLVAALLFQKEEFKPAVKRLLMLCFSATVTGLAVAYAPVIPSLLHTLVGRGRSPFNFAFPWMVLKYISGTQSSVFALSAVLIALLGAVDLARRNKTLLAYVVILFLGPLLLMWFSRPFDLYPRFFVYWLPFYILLILAGIRRTWVTHVSHQRAVVRNGFCVLVAIVTLSVMVRWTLSLGEWVADEGYREATRAAAMGADPDTAFCAIGGSRTIWRYYLKKPIVTPLTVSDLQVLAAGHPEVRCLYYQAPWQNAEQTRIAHFLFEHAYCSQYKGHIWFVYRSNNLQAVQRSYDR